MGHECERLYRAVLSANSFQPRRVTAIPSTTLPPGIMTPTLPTERHAQDFMGEDRLSDFA